MTIFLIILIILLFFGSGYGYYGGPARAGWAPFPGLLGLILIILLIYLLL